MPDVMGGQPTGFWERTAPGVKYPDLNKRLNGLPDWLRAIEEKVGRPLSAATSKAADVLTFGLASPLIDKLTGQQTYSRLAKEVQQEHEGLAKAGEIAGTLGSMAMGRIPSGLMVAKEAPAIAKAAAPAVRKAIDWGKAAALAGSGAGLGGLEAGVRTATGQQEGGLAGNVAAGMGLGALGGGLGSIASDKLAQFLEHLPKRTAKARLKTADMNRRDMMAVLRRQAGAGSGALKQAEEASDVARDVAEIVKKYNLDVEGNLEKVANWQRGKWKQIDDVFEAAVGDTQASKLLEGMMTFDELDELGKKFGTDKVHEVVNGLMKKAGQIQGLANTRDLLQRSIDASMKATDEDAGSALRQIAGTLRGRLDDKVAEIAKQGGVDLGMPFSQFKHEYGLLQPVARGVAREEIAPQGVVMNSPTMEKLGVAELLKKNAPMIGMGGAGLGVGGLTGKEGETTEQRISRMALGAVGGAVASKALGRAATRTLAGLDPVARKLAVLAPRAQNLSRAAAIGGAKAATAAVRKEAVQQTAPETPVQQEAAETGAAAGQAISSGDTSAYKNQIAERLRERWIRAGMEQYYPGQFDAFITYAREKTGGFEPTKTAQIMYADPEERKKFLDALEVSRTLTENLPLAERRETGVLGGQKMETEEQRKNAIAYQLLQNIFKKQMAGMPEGATAMGYTLFKKIMEDKKLSTDQKIAQMKKILSQYGVAFNLVQQAGIA